MRIFVIGSIVALLATASLPEAQAAGKPNYDKKMQVGQLLYFNGNVEQAIKAFRTAESLKPQAVEPRLSLVNIYVQKGDLDDAIEECREIIKLKPAHRDVHLILGNLLRTKAGSAKSEDEKKQHLEDAVKMLEKARDLKANKALIENTLGVIHVQKGDFDKAMHHINNALGENNNIPDAHLIKGVLLFKKGDKDAALKELDLAIKQKGKHAEARCTKADILFSMGKQTEAMEEYKKAAEDDSRYYQSYSGMGNILIAEKKYSEALEQLDKAYNIKPEDKNVLYSMAVCYEKMGKLDQAHKFFQAGVMLETDPTIKAQIQMHIQQLNQHGLFNLPSIFNPSEMGSGELSGGSGFSGINESFKDLIKIGGKKKGAEGSETQNQK